MWESTPDRRPDWTIPASRPPFSRPVYCIAAVDNGRSQRCPDEFRPAQVEHRTSADTWSRFRFGPPDNDNKRVPFPDSQFPLEFSDILLASQSARRRGEGQYEAEAQGLRDAIAEIGDCDLVAHSNGCAISTLALLDDSTKDKVRKFVMVEPGPPQTQCCQHLEFVKTSVVWGAHYGKMIGKVTVINRLEHGIVGNSHFPMHDRNSDQVGHLIIGWLKVP